MPASASQLLGLNVWDTVLLPISTVKYVFLSVGMCIWRYGQWRPVEAAWGPLKLECRLSDVGAGDQAQALWKGGAYPQPLSPSVLQPVSYCDNDLGCLL